MTRRRRRRCTSGNDCLRGAFGWYGHPLKVLIFRKLSKILFGCRNRAFPTVIVIEGEVFALPVRAQL